MTRYSAVAQASSPPVTSPEVTARGIGNVFDFTRAVLADPRLLTQVPDGVTLVLLPAEDPELLEEQVEAGLMAVREGHDVLFRHVRRVEKNLRPSAKSAQASQANGDR